MNPYNVAVGQVWMDNDPRTVPYHGHNRYLEVTAISGAYAEGQWFHYEVAANGRRHRVNTRRTRTRLDRFKPTASGYKRVS